MNTSSTTKIFLLSDIHLGNDQIFAPKTKLLSKLSTLVTPNDVIVMAGDLTDSGTGKSKLLCCMCTNNLSLEDQVEAFNKQIYTPLKRKTPHVLFCHGNHDDTQVDILNKVIKIPMIDFINQEFKDATDEGYYMYIHNNICFIILGKYPTEKSLQYIDIVRYITKHQYPLILVCHYQLTKQSQYDFWSDTDKKAFIDYLDSNTDNDILCVLHGHIHDTYSYTISRHNIPVYCGSSLTSFYELSISNGKLLTTNIINLSS